MIIHQLIHQIIIMKTIHHLKKHQNQSKPQRVGSEAYGTVKKKILHYYRP